MRVLATIALALAAVAVAASAPAAEVSDAVVLAITTKHCAPCHARAPVHPAFDKPPKDLSFETVEDLRRQAANVAAQVEDRIMPLGNETEMTDAEREELLRWLAALK